MPKRLVVCADGTWNVPDRKDRGEVCPSNVAKLILALEPRDRQGVEQVPLYHKGVGTGRLDRLRGGAVGWGLSAHVQDAYRSVVENYEPGDEIFLFGFSRGAFTVRSTAGLIRNSGVLRREHREKVGDAYQLYRRRDDEAHPTGVEAQLFRKQYSRDVRIRFIGVWDTVGALGIPAGIPWLPVTLGFINRRWAFHDTALSTTVDHAYHAVAIDERRPQFEPTLWEQQEDAGGQIMEQAWFAGVHTNVGGGYQDTGLSDLAFLWMKEKAEACGLAFNQEYIEQTIKPNHLGELRESKVGLFRLFPDKVRAIGVEKRSNESVHPSAVRRLAESRNPAYAPSNLTDYLKRQEANGGG